MPNAPFSRRRFVSGISAAVAAVPYCISGTTSLLSMLSHTATDLFTGRQQRKHISLQTPASLLR